MYVLEAFEEELKRLGLYEAIRATCFGINISVPTFYAILELNCLASGTFFTPVGELGMVLHEMWEVSNIPMGFMPYEEYFSFAEELKQLEEDELALYETYWELMRHFFICLDHHPSHENTNSLKTWAECLFPVVGGPLEDLQAPVEDDRVADSKIKMPCSLRLTGRVHEKRCDVCFSIILRK